MADREDDIEVRLEREYQRGLADGLRRAGAGLLEQSGHLFKEGKDDRAGWLREIARGILKAATEEAPAPYQASIPDPAGVRVPLGEPDPRAHAEIKGKPKASK